MNQRYSEYKNLDLTRIADEILKYWDEHNTFEESIKLREGKPPYVFYEGPPSANGVPGIHHVIARAIKDLFCRYKTLKGFQVKRKAGWDTHGLPIEIGVEKTLGITKDDIGKTISVEDYNKACRKDVMKYKDLWDDLTKRIGYWVDLENPYITFENKYIETVWYLLKKLYEKNLLYKGYTIQPYSPAAGTGLSTHELNQPGCYKNVKDTTIIAQFKVIKDAKSEFLFGNDDNVFILAWTTTPWTLPSNTALAVGKDITYVKVSAKNKYSGNFENIVCAENLLESVLAGTETTGEKKTFKGKELAGINYEQLIDWVKPNGDAFRVIIGDFVTTEDGTGIVHIAPTFGADDFRVAKQNDIAALHVTDKNGVEHPLVDKKGKFFSIDELGDEFVKNNVRETYQGFAGKYVKNEFDINNTDPKAETTDVSIAIWLKGQNKTWNIAKYEHTYPHCWRTDKPILYYPLDSWFVKTTEYKARMIELNKTINWKPKATGTGRFGNWLENLVDWNLSRSRYWGVPLPIWTNEDKSEQKCIGSIEELKAEIEKSIKAGFMKNNPFVNYNPNALSSQNYMTFDIHRPYVDDIILVSDKGQKMKRETDLIDVWFDSGSMPYAQFHYPFENLEEFKNSFPADFIAEGVDQTRGWFFTLHAIAVMLFDSVAYKNVVSNGLVLDKNGNKMSKRLGNAVDPFTTIDKYGPDATRWYMLTNAQPWDNLKFDMEGIAEIQRKFFGTLYNTYSFFALYANIDNFKYSEEEIALEKRPEIDRWIISELNSLIKRVDEYYDDYEPTKAGRAIQEFVDEHLSNWYVRLCRRRFWKGDYTDDKIAAYQTLYKCLEVISQLASPIAPFFMERLFIDLNNVTGKQNIKSVHLTNFPEADEKHIDKDLEERMQLAQKFSSMVLSLRKKINIRVRQPLAKIIIPVQNPRFQKQVESIKNLILSEVNVKGIDFISNSESILVKKIKPNFKTLGPRFGKMMKAIADKVVNFTQQDINKLESEQKYMLNIDNTDVELLISDVEIIFDDIPGLVVTNIGSLTVALDTNISEELKEEGIARELINRIQNIRKDKNFEVTDKIKVIIENHPEIETAIKNNFNYICSETLATNLDVTDNLNGNEKLKIELTEDISTFITIHKN